MSGEATRPRPGRRKWWVRRWHRWLGVVFALPLLWLAVSGLLLRHAEGLGLHEAQVRSGWLLERYGMIPDGLPRGRAAGARTVAEWGENLFLDGVLLEESGVLVGVAVKGRDVVVATEDYLLVYDPAGMLVDQLGEESLPAVPLESLGTEGSGALVVRAGGAAARITGDFLAHEDAASAEVNWSVVVDLDDGERDELAARLAEQAGVSWHRVLLDLHSGNLLGGVSRWAVDVVAIGIIALTMMGAGMMVRKSRVGARAGRGGDPEAR